MTYDNRNDFDFDTVISISFVAGNVPHSAPYRLLVPQATDTQSLARDTP